MRKNMVVVLLIGMMVGAFTGVGQAAVVYADQAFGSTGVTNVDAIIGAPNGDFATLEAGSYIDLKFAGYFQDKPTGVDFALYFIHPEVDEPPVAVTARNIDGITWVDLTQVGGAGYARTYEIFGTGTEYYDTIRVTSLVYVNGPTGGLATFATVPEAGSLLLFCTGMIGLVGYRRVRRMQ